MGPPKMIKDPEASKPEDWDDRAKLEDWDDEMDGEWEPPMIDNPEYKGEWKPRQIDNPEYKGNWVHPEIDNPEYDAEECKKLGKYDEICKFGFDLWQVKSGTIFDNILITDDVEEAWGQTKDAEKKMKDEQDEEEKAKAEAEQKNAEDEEDEDEDIDDIDDEDTKEEEAHDEL